MDKTFFSTYLKLHNVTVNDAFWNPITETVRTEMIPYQYNALFDRIEGAEKSYCMENFVKAGKVVKALKEGKTVPVYPADKWYYDENNAKSGAFHGWVFQDTDAYKWLEAVSYSLIHHFDPDLKQKAEEMIELICAAQLENGYLDTLYIINNRDEVFTNLRDFHELYCFGHLAEAAVAYYESTKERKLLDATLRFADLICKTFGNEAGQIKGYPGHEIAEMALVKLYDLTGNNAYLKTAKFFIDERGKKPYYFDTERNQTTGNDHYHYHQAHCEVRKQNEAVGHAVRGVYLYSGMADVARRTNDDGLFQACQNIWQNIENKKMYITGGIGSTVHGEAFSFDYDLPNDLAYSETCASIGLIFFAKRMSEIRADAHYASVAERALYNTVLSGMAEDGKSFFYVNPLEVLPSACRKDERKRHIKAVRQKWFSCACCPPNLARLLTSLGAYLYSENDSTIYVHQWIASSAKAKNANIEITSTYPEDGKATIKITPKKALTLAVRIPDWSRDFEISAPFDVKNGYAYFAITAPCEIHFDFKAKPRAVKCSNLVRENVGKAAVMKGPFVYCIEEADNGHDLQMLRLDRNTSFTKDGMFIIAEGYRQSPDDRLYSDDLSVNETKCDIRFLPYYRWGNRGENEMSVYVRI